jgi:hypothetical protein
MKPKKAKVRAITLQEIRLIEQLRRHPEIGDRVLSILEIAGSEEGPLKTADEVEGLLIEEMRRLGHVTMTRWAIQAEARVGTELKDQDSSVLSRKKKR